MQWAVMCFLLRRILTLLRRGITQLRHLAFLWRAENLVRRYARQNKITVTRGEFLVKVTGSLPGHWVPTALSG